MIEGVSSLASSPEYSYCAKRLVTAFDPDRNYKISEADFGKGVESLGICCGQY